MILAHPLIDQAKEFAVRMHGSQRYGTKPYAVHLKAVADKVMFWNGTAQQIAAAWLHDTMEDTMDPLTIVEKRVIIERKFGAAVESIVFCCTGTCLGRKEAFEEQMEKLDMRPDAMLVKTADRWCNMTAVADDLEFETEDRKIERLGRVAEYYLREYERFRFVSRNALMNREIEAELDGAYDRLVSIMEKYR